MARPLLTICAHRRGGELTMQRATTALNSAPAGFGAPAGFEPATPEPNSAARPCLRAHPPGAVWVHSEIRRRAVHFQECRFSFRTTGRSLSLSNEIEIDFQLDGVRHAQQHGHTRLLDLQIFEGERGRGAAGNTTVHELNGSLPDGR